ncbi:MAG: inositol monophosphatase [Anaerolineales bacterium]|nr:inositol monophosphatase [Anaerolineales bacterium]
MRPELLDLEILARQAGAILRAHFGQRLHIEHKGVIDLVTEADRHSEEFLLYEIRHRFRRQRIIAEESGGVSGEGGQVWYIDPLDGTVNYAHGVPIFSVSIAYAEDGKVRLGVVYDPTRDECFSASRQQGAWLNGKAIQVATPQDLDHSLLVTGFPYDIRTNPHNNLDHYTRFALNSQGVRRLGSAALDLCYVASGRFDGYWEISLQPWDVAAGGLIAEEAGAIVTNLLGGKDYLSPPQSVVASSQVIHAKMLAILGEVNAQTQPAQPVRSNPG